MTTDPALVGNTKTLSDTDVERVRNNRYYSGFGAQAQTCKCPMCQVLHQYTIFYSGPGIPRVYCPLCYPITRRKADEPMQLSNTTTKGARV